MFTSYNSQITSLVGMEQPSIEAFNEADLGNEFELKEILDPPEDLACLHQVALESHPWSGKLTFRSICEPAAEAPAQMYTRFKAVVRHGS